MSKFNLRKGYQKVVDKAKSIKFFQLRKFTFLVPAVVVLIMLICGTTYVLSPKYGSSFANIGVDFQGGTRLTVENNASNRDYQYDLAIIEKVVTEKYGFSIGTSQESGESATVVRYGLESWKDDPTKIGKNYSEGNGTEEMKDINEAIMADITEAIKTDSRYAAEFAKQDAPTVVTTANLIGNESSIKLLKTACLAVGIALIAMFLYIIIRFSPFFALSAIIALIHDVLIMMAFTVIFRVEIDSTIVASIITIVAYSINNTIIVFDRIRESIKPFKKGNKRYDVPVIVNDALGSTLTRSFYTTLTTMITIVLLASIARNSTITSFALPIIFGLIGGFYSSLFIAAPMWGTLSEAWEKHKRNKANPNTYRKKGRFAKKVD